MAAECTRHVAIDLGASGGRVALGVVEDGVLRMELLHRFPNQGVPVGPHLYWDALFLWREALEGLRRAAAQGPVASVGVTTWGLDYALLDQGGGLLDMPHHYRDPRNDGMMAAEGGRMARQHLYERTGTQFLDMNALWQLRAHERQMPGILSRADRLLMMPDLFHYWLSGVPASERSIASTSQFYDPTGRAWATDVLDAFDIPARLMPPLVDPGTVLGPLRPELAEQPGLSNTLVIPPAAHDTASAVAAIPAEPGPWAYISSGTWSLVGVETARPVISAAALNANLTNEVGFGDTIRLLKNMTGLWLLQECRRAWNGMDYAALYELAAKAPAVAVVDPDDPAFVAPGADMPVRIQARCQAMGQAVPEGPGPMTRTILESLSLKAALILAEIACVTGEQARRLHVVGGGAQIRLLNGLLARACGVRVAAGPVEATAMGNLLIQAQALGGIAPGTLREVVRRSDPPVLTTPDQAPDMLMDLAAYRALLAKRVGSVVPG